VVPKSIIEAMANNEILQIVVFSIFTGVALTALGEKGKQLVVVADEVAHVMLKITNYVMLVAPVAVFAAVAATVTTQGLGILVTYGKFMGEFYLCLIILWFLLILGGFILACAPCGRRLGPGTGTADRASHRDPRQGAQSRGDNAGLSRGVVPLLLRCS
jgi:Na+/H+-dicarboxylate symporter